MRSTSTAIKVLAVVVLIAASVASAQDSQTLVRQLAGKAEAPARNATQLTEAYQKAIDYLLPLMSADDVGARYDYQIMLQDMGSHAARPGAETEREVLAKVMIETLQQADMPGTVRNWFMLQIERIGKGESVPALTKLLESEDKHLRDFARRALEKNPAPGATEALLDALKAAEDATLKIGLINSLGQRRAQEALEPIAEALKDADPKVGAAAVTALSLISGPNSGKALVGVLNKPTGPITLKAAQALADIAQELVAQTNYGDAAQIYDFLYRGATGKARDGDDYNPFSIRIAGLNGLAVCAPDKLAAVIGEVMRDADPRVRDVAVQAARLAPTKAPMQILCEMMADLEPYYQVQVLGLIADRGDLSSLKYAEEALASEDDAVRVGAVEAVASIGSGPGTELLMDVALNGRGRARRAAERGLVLMVGPGVEEVIAAQAASGDAKARALALGLLSQRRMPGATETLLRYAREGDDDIRSAAFQALADVADLVDVDTLAELVVETKADGVRRSGISALEAVLAKARDKDAAARAVVTKMEAADTDAKVALVNCLDAAGGAMALEAVVEMTRSSNEDLRNAGVRTLGNWPDYAGAEKLLAIASNSQTSLTHYVLAMRGALRLIGTSNNAPLDDRVALCFKAFEMARRDDEKRQAIAVMGSLPNSKIAERLLALAQGDDFKVEAGLAAVDLAGRMIRQDREAARALAQRVRDLDISDEVNRRADGIIRGRRR